MGIRDMLVRIRIPEKNPYLWLMDLDPTLDLPENNACYPR